MTLMDKKTMKVSEMRKLLGLKKTESYWLVHKGYFKTFLVCGVMRVDVESFEAWYANQFHYKKITGERPGCTLGYTMSVAEMVELLGISSWSGYELVKKKVFNTRIINDVMRRLFLPQIQRCLQTYTKSIP